jgi:hypothetical protein
MESAIDTQVLTREVTIAARPETVWKLLAEPAMQSSWWGTGLAFEAGQLSRPACDRRRRRRSGNAIPSWTRCKGARPRRRAGASHFSSSFSAAELMQ